MRRMMSYFACVAVFVLVVASPACQTISTEDRAAARAVHVDLQDTLANARTEAQTQPDNKDLMDLIARIETALVAIEPIVNAPTNDVAIGGLLIQAAKFVPGEYGLIATLVASGIATVLGKRSRKTRESMRSLARVLERAKSDDGTVTFDKQTSRALNVALGPFGKRIVDEAQGSKTALPL